MICGPKFVGATADDTHVLLWSKVALTETLLPNEHAQLYEWTRAAPSSQQLQLVSVLPADEGGGAPGAGAELGDHNNVDARNAISDGGSRVFFTSNGQLYLRNNATQPQSPIENGKCVVPSDACTIRLDLPEAGFGAVGVASATYQFASTDGSRVFFTDSQKLTSDSGNEQNLYECEIKEAAAGEPECKLSDLTPRGASGENADVLGGIPGASEDGAYVYFVADGILENSSMPVPGAVHGTCRNGVYSPGAQCNLYVRHDGTTKLVAVLSGADSPDWGNAGVLTSLSARVSPDGDWLAFMSSRALTGYDNEDVTSRASGERRDEETYLYDAATGRMSCASCNPSGARPVGEEYGPEGHNMPVVGGDRLWAETSWLAADVPDWTPYELGTSRYQSRYLSNTGRLFFNARDPLVPQAVNNNWDVYEYEPEGLGTCSSSTSTGSDVFKPARSYTTEAEGKQQQGEEGAGCVGLISSGESPDESAFLDASETGGEGPNGEELEQGGGDVFFLTAEKLSKSDTDNSYDVYDAHECTTESACPPAEAEAPPACTTTDACRAAPTPQPEVFGAPASATFSGPGNLTPPPPVPPKPPTAAELRAKHLKTALAACKKHFRHNKNKRKACEKQARKQYGHIAKSAKRGK